MCIALKIHFPYSLNNYDVQQIGANHIYFSEEDTKKKVADFVEKSFLPSNALLLDAVKSKNRKVKLHISGTAIELFSQFKKEAIESLKELASQKNVSIVQSSYYNSRSEYFSLKEYKEQAEKHTCLMRNMFGKSPVAQLCSGGHHCSQHMLSPFEYPQINEWSEVNFPQQWINSIVAIYESKRRESDSGFWNKGYNKDLLQKLYSLEKMVKATSDNLLILKWRKLQDVSYYSFQADHDQSASIKNILTDLEILLIRKFLFKTKRSQKDLPTIL